LVYAKRYYSILTISAALINYF